MLRYSFLLRNKDKIHISSAQRDKTFSPSICTKYKFHCRWSAPGLITFYKILRRVSLHRFLSFVLLNPRRKLETLSHGNDIKRISKRRFVPVDPTTIQEHEDTHYFFLFARLRIPTRVSIFRILAPKINESFNISPCYRKFDRKENLNYEILEMMRRKCRVENCSIRNTSREERVFNSLSRACHIERNGPKFSLKRILRNSLEQ